MATREQAVTALFNVLKSAAAFKVASRRLRDPEGLDPATETPALFLVEETDKWDRTAGYNMLAKKDMRLRAILYCSLPPTDVNSIPSSIINAALDAIDDLFKPDNVQTDTFTLGGLVQACLLDGESQRAPGDITGKALAIVPIRILFP